MIYYTGEFHNCLILVLTECQSAQLDIENIKEHLNKMASKCNATANNLKYEAKNVTQWMQERPMAHSSRNLTTEHQTLLKKICGMLTRRAEKMVRDLTSPKCASDGSFKSMQCGLFGKRCWCVDENGRKRGSVKSRNKLNCSRSEGKTKGRGAETL